MKKQVGGDHYQKSAIQPIDFIIANGLNFCEGNVIKYICRYKYKNGVEDLKKARHYIDIMIKEYYEKKGDSLKTVFEKHPMYAPIKVGDLGVGYNDLQNVKESFENDCIEIEKIKSICLHSELKYETEYYLYKHFFKVSENETIAEIKERFLMENS